VAPDVTANVVLTVLLAAIARRVTALPAIVLHVMVKDVRRATGKDDLPAKAVVHVKVKGDLRADANRDVAKDLRADLKAVRWAHRVLNASSKMQCGLIPTPMESSAKKS
jgi:hypothetical protein